MSFPLAKLLAKCNVHPNIITLTSNVLVVISFYFLFSQEIILFIVFWITAEVFDICDGTVARLTGKTSESGAFFDHFSDQVKIFLFFICISLYFKSEIITLLAFLSAGIFLLYIDISKRVEIFKLKYPGSSKSENNNNSDTTFLRKIYNHIFLIHGHTMVILPFFVISNDVAILGLSFFIVVAFKNFLGSLRAQIKLF